MNHGLLLIPVLPGLAALVIFVLGRRLSLRGSSAIAVLASAASLVLTCGVVFQGLLSLAEPGLAGSGKAEIWTLGEFLRFGEEWKASLGLRMDRLSGLMSLLVTFAGTLILIFSIDYMREDKEPVRFFASVSLFISSMLVLVLSENLILLFLGWEGVGLCSYLLIGFWYENPAYAAAGRKAFVVNRVGDFGVIIGTFLIVAATRSFEFADINAKAHMLVGEGGGLVTGDVSPMVHSLFGHVSIAGAACLFLFLGCAGKSAQIPLYVWLPDAMAGPTPVSALIHAATMVTAGVYLCCRLSGVFVQSPTAMSVIAVVGATTALFAASIGLVQNQLKKILAYSTVSQLGFMFAAVGVGAFAAGFFHVFTHAFFKACLFLGAGAVMHAVHAHGDADIWKLGGMRKHLPRVHWTFLVSCAAIAGFPLTSGFFSKDEILNGATTVAFAHDGAIPSWVGWFVYVVLVVAATMTAFYMFRLYFVTFWGEYRSAGPAPAHASHVHLPANLDVDEDAPTQIVRLPEVPAHDAHGTDAHGGGHDDHGHDEHAYAPVPHNPENAITIPLAVLAIGAAVLGFLGMPHWLHVPHVWVDWLAPVLNAGHEAAEEGHHAGAGPAEVLAMLGGFTAMAVGIGLAYAFYFKPSETPARIKAAWPRLHALLMDKWRVDEFYEATVLRGMRSIADASAAIDKVFVDGLLAKVTAIVVQIGGYLLSRLQSGLVYAYATAMVVGFVFVGWWFLVPHASVTTVTEGPTVKYEASKGLGYEYRWNVDGKGLLTWSRESSSVEQAYKHGDYIAMVVQVKDKGQPVKDIMVRPGHSVVMDPVLLGREWQKDDHNATPPAFTFNRAGQELLMRPNGAAVAVPGGAHGNQAKLHVGDTVGIGLGAVTLEVRGVVRGTLEVRNVFGYTTKREIETSVAASTEEPTPPADGAPRQAPAEPTEHTAVQQSPGPIQLARLGGAL